MTGLHSGLTKIVGLAACMSALVYMPLGAVHDAYAAKGKGDLMPVHAKEQKQGPMMLTLGKADIIALPGHVSDVLVANPSVVDVQAVQSDKLYVVGLSIGDTNIIALDSKGNVVKRIDIHVSYDIDAIQAMVNHLFPNEGAKVGAVHDQILLTGTVSNPETAGRIANLVGHYVTDLQNSSTNMDSAVSNLMEVRGEQQVMLKVKIIEANRSMLKELGLETAINDPNEGASYTVFGKTPPSSAIPGGRGKAVSAAGGAGLALSQDPIASASLLLDSGLRGVGSLGMFLNALEEENLINVLAEPNLTAVSGQKAGFLAGGEFPVPIGRDQFGNITVEFRQFGVSLNFKPVVLSEDRISLQLNTEVSALDNTNAVTLADVVVPGLNIRRADTTVEMPSGGSLMIAGLLQSKAAQGLSGLPGIKNTPILGDLMSSDSFRRDETELVVIVTPYLVEPFANKDGSDKKPKEHGQLAKIFSNNVRRHFHLADDSVLSTSDPYGYILD